MNARRKGARGGPSQRSTGRPRFLQVPVPKTAARAHSGSSSSDRSGFGPDHTGIFRAHGGPAGETIDFCSEAMLRVLLFCVLAFCSAALKVPTLLSRRNAFAAACSVALPNSALAILPLCTEVNLPPNSEGCRTPYQFSYMGSTAKYATGIPEQEAKRAAIKAKQEKEKALREAAMEKRKAR